MTEVEHMVDDSSGVTSREKIRHHLPGDGAIWFCVLGDLIIFGAYFVTFIVFRARDEASFVASAGHLNLGIGFINTLLLLASSWLVARCVIAARAGNDQRAIQFAAGAAACGVLFIVIKLYEWWSEATRGFTLTKDGFFSFYYMLTGAHLLHVIIGLVILVVAIVHLRLQSPTRTSVAEQGATFWHMVDLLWVLIFTLLYVVR
jgi:nitric oxide reductase NorE protein